MKWNEIINITVHFNLFNSFSFSSLASSTSSSHSSLISFSLTRTVQCQVPTKVRSKSWSCQKHFFFIAQLIHFILNFSQINFAIIVFIKLQCGCCHFKSLKRDQLSFNYIIKSHILSALTHLCLPSNRHPQHICCHNCSRLWTSQLPCRVELSICS